MYYAIHDKNNLVSIRLPGSSETWAVGIFQNIGPKDRQLAIKSNRNDCAEDNFHGRFIKHLESDVDGWELWQSRPLSENHPKTAEDAPRTNAN